MALDPTSQDPCSLLNVAGFPNLFIPSTQTDTSVAYPLIANSGTLITFSQSLTSASMDNNVLASQQASSGFRLIQFLSGAGVASADTTKNFTKMKYVALSPTPGSGLYKSIIDNYIATMASSYLNPPFSSATGASLLSSAQFWNPSDSTNGRITNPTSVLGKLISEGYLLSESQIYQPAQLTGDAPTPNTECLIYLYSLSQTGLLTPLQQALQNKYEAMNLRFFGAFMVEYCFYRSRYEFLLTQYFNVYTTPTTGTGAYVSPSQAITNAIFGTGNALPSTSTSTNLRQVDYLKGLAFHMACLNMRMADMRALLSAVNTYYNGVFMHIQGTINTATEVGSNSHLTTTINTLQISAKDANQYLVEADFAQEAMKYNSEKNRYSNILLALYAFLNISALAAIFQLSRV